MRRASMRRWKLPMAAGVVVLAATVATGCTGAPARTGLITHVEERPSASASAPVVVPSPGAFDPLLTQQACTAAALSTFDSTRLFHSQMAVIERAAADDDTATLIAAANLIQRSFVQLAHGLALLSHRSLSPEVAQALQEASQTVTEISSNTYAGSTADVSTKLADVTTSVLTACA
jgi:hypothetical protein